MKNKKFYFAILSCIRHTSRKGVRILREVHSIIYFMNVFNYTSIKLEGELVEIWEYFGKIDGYGEKH